MSNSMNSAPDRRDDGFRVSDAAVERAVAGVLADSRESGLSLVYSAWSIAAALALMVGLGFALAEAMKPPPCVTFACQLEALTDEELVGIMELIDEDMTLGLEDEVWPSTY